MKERVFFVNNTHTHFFIFGLFRLVVILLQKKRETSQEDFLVVELRGVFVSFIFLHLHFSVKV